ncbi:glucose-1-phosphate adenylyltransferase GlgC [Thermoanaerobacter kivui]|uniref:Glucose-1-phosphate adenylyltransferase n=2 Tax=Thermoanaerobacter kivui TaxID=2325 RepID=A0A097AR52_THEKI|nr:glucose-1-phosphate adenylyltransferase [Thermoanaerobacter kivui]AIS52278.1 glucose-1-phosphate adenylyltransferase GlgC [Thermoanaerobacter kivui]
MKREIIALILAGGQGSRLESLTKTNAKPAVEFGGKYRIIDFTLSNCSNSSIEVVGVLTQYQPLILHSHIGIGSAWDLDRVNGGVTILPPYTGEKGGSWYSGTADAVLKNINFVERYSPENLLILSGDHIYKMRYLKMLKFHKQKDADVTIAVTKVPIEEASRFGIMNTYEDYRIYEFEEKPKKPKSTLASMGIYIFKWDKLKEVLLEDAQDESSSHDFGKDIIPKMLKKGYRMYAYLFKGYWKDVGTISSYWEASMDLINEDPYSSKEGIDLNLFDKNWKIYSFSFAYPPHYIGPSAEVSNSLIVEGCMVFGTVLNSVLSYGVMVGENAEVKNSITMSDTVIEEGAKVINSIIGPKVVIKRGSVIGNEKRITVIKEGEVVEGIMG